MRPSSRDDAILPQASFRCRQIIMRSTSFQHDRAPQRGNHDQRRPEGRGREWPVPNFFTTESAKPYSRK